MTGFELTPSFGLLEAYCLRLSLTLLHFLWQGFFIGLLAFWAARSLQRRSAKARYLAHTAAMGLMAMCLLITFVSTPLPHIDTMAREMTTNRVAMNPGIEATGAPAMGPLADEVPLRESAGEDNAASLPGMATDDGELANELPSSDTSGRIGESGTSATNSSPPAGVRGAQPAASGATLTAGRHPWAKGVAAVYLLGVMAMMVRVTFALWGGQRLRGDSTLIEEPRLLETVQLQARRIGLNAVPAIAYCHRIATPAVIGILRPMILLPPSAVTGLSTDELEALLIHELAHIRRYDLLVNLLQRLVEAFLFFHPAVWYVSRRLNVEREHCCDDLVLSTGIPRLGYADALVRMAEICAGAPAASETALAASAGTSPSELKLRVLRLLEPAQQDGPRLHLTRSGVACFVALWLAVMLAPTAFESWPGSDSDAGAAETEGPPLDRAALLALAQQDQFEEGKVVTLDPIHGTIKGRLGKPVVGAKVYLREHPRSWKSWGRNTPTETRDLALTVSDAKGQFRFENVQSQPLNVLRKDVLPVDVIVVAEGYAAAWQQCSEYGAVDFQLKLGAKVHGRIQDEHGKPAAGTTIRVLRFLPLTEIANMHLAGHGYPRTVGNTLDLACAGFQIAATVDEQGEFVLPGLPENSGIVLEVSDPRFHCEVVYTTANPDHPVWRESAKLSEPVASSYFVPSPYASSLAVPPETKRRARFGLRESVQVSPIQIVLHRGIQLRVRVVDDQTGEPVPGVRLPEGPIFMYPGRGATNDKGEYQYTQLEPGHLFLEAAAPEGSKWINQHAEIELAEGVLDVDAQIRLTPAALISGRVIDRTTGRGIAGVPLRHIVPRDHGSAIASAKTDQDGRFRIMGAPGEGSVNLHGSVPGYETPIRSGSVPDRFRRSVTATLDQPHTELVFELEPDVLFHGRTLDAEGEPIGGVEISGQIPRGSFGSGYSYSSRNLKSHSDGRYVLAGFYADVLQKRQPEIPVLFRDETRGLAVRVAFSPPTDDAQEIERDIRLQAAGTVTGRVINEHTNEPIANAGVGVSLWTGNSGQHIGSAKTDAQGQYSYHGLIPDEEHTVELRAEGYVAAGGRSAYSEHFTVKAGDTKAMPDFPMTPKAIAQSTVDIPKVEAPGIDGLSPEKALELLLSKFEKDRTAYRKRLDVTKDRNERNKIVARQEPTVAYSEAFEALAKANLGTDVELKSLIWICDASVVAGIDSSDLYDRKEEAARRLMENYIDRKEIVDCLESMVYRTEKPHETAQLLIEKSPHREIQGRACLLAAQVFERDLDMAHRFGGTPSEKARQKAIQYYRRVIADYADIPTWRHETIGTQAKKALNELENLWVGEVAPDIVGEDLDGKPMKLSDFRGKIVVLAFTDRIRYWSLLPKTMAEYAGDGQVVVLGVYAGQDREAARKEVVENKIPWRIWYDGPKDPGPIVSAWNNTSWPNAHVLDQQGVIRYKDVDRNRIPAAIENLWPDPE